MKSKSSSIRILVGLSVSLGFLYLALKGLDWPRFIDSLTGLSLFPLLIALLFLGGDFFLRIYRWWKMLQVMDPGLPLSNCVWPFLVSIAANNVLPLRAGDFIRTFGFRTDLRSPGMRLLGTLVIERLLDLLVLLGFFFVGTVWLPEGVLPHYLIRGAQIIGVSAISLLLTLMFFPHLVRSLFQSVLALVPEDGKVFADKLRVLAEPFFQALQILRSMRFTARLLGLSLLAWGMEGAVFVCVGWSLQEIVPALGAWFSMTTGTLATLLPSSPGYVGTFDYFTMLGVMAYGTTKHAAIAFAVLVHGVIWLPLTLAGGLYLATPKGLLIWTNRWRYQDAGKRGGVNAE